MVLVLSRKLYAQDINPALCIDRSLEKHYPNIDYHRLYVGEIEKILVRA